MVKQMRFDNPTDTVASAGLRFAIEVLAWVAGPWAAGEISPWLIAPTAVVLIGLVGIFSTPGNKTKIVVATPGPARLGIELLLHVIVATAPWLVWPQWAAIACGAVVVGSLVAGIPRTRWMLNAPRHPLA
jgi:hypothetical protein